MQTIRRALTAALLASTLHPVSTLASDLALGSLSWSSTGTTGVIGATSTVPLSPVGNASFGYLSTYGGLYDLSPLVLRDEGNGTRNQTNGSRMVSSVFSAAANDTLTLHFNYVSTDGRGYDDYAWARLVNDADSSTAAWLFTARSTNSANGNVVPGNVLKRQVDGNLPDRLDAVLNDGNTVGFNVKGTEWTPLGFSSGVCWDSANTCGPTGWIQSVFSITAAGAYRLEFGVINWGDEAYDSGLAFDFTGLRSAAVAPVPEPGLSALMLAGLGLIAAVARRRAPGTA